MSDSNMREKGINSPKLYISKYKNIKVKLSNICEKDTKEKSLLLNSIHNKRETDNLN